MPFAPHVVYYFYGKRPRGAKTQEMRECFVNGCTPFLSRRTLWGAVVVALALMVLGSLVDYPLSSALYDDSSPFALFFAAYGAIPAPLGCVAAGTLFLCGRSGARRGRAGQGARAVTARGGAVRGGVAGRGGDGEVAAGRRAATGVEQERLKSR